MPLYFVTHGEGWASREVVDHFVRYAEVCFNRYKDLVKYWLTFNEVDSVFRHPFTTVGIVEENYPSKLKAEEAIYKALHHQLVASAQTAVKAPDQNGQEMSYDFTGAAENPAVFILCRRMLCSN